MTWFRRASPATASWNLFKTLLQVVFFWGLFLFVLPPMIIAAAETFGLRSHPSETARVVGAGIFVLASALGLASAAAIATQGAGTPLPIDAPRRLVVIGPYAWVRNPMAVAGIAQGFGVALWHGSWVVACYVIAGGLLWHNLVRPVEEVDLERTFGADFVRYRDGVSLWWPRKRRS